ncbi:S41 family peptidase [Caenimonas soli]|uniref:S41 family peptidase n=1 Tax=Caenimonas soli TaxID=2735555 RepID=UPI0015524EEB|nr:S41 family peptidase [Caenimonas soli]NPC58344.1 S41 family peptidase [Caenimonas soli]
MSHAFPTLRACAAACLLFAGSASLAALPSAATDEDVVTSLQDAYARSVPPGEQADLHRELLATVLQRVKRSHATEVDLPAFAAVAMKVMEPLPPGGGDPMEVFKKAINEALRTLDPHSRYLDARAQGNERGGLSSFGGLGLEVEPSEGAVRVVASMPDSPAARAGLAPGDLIVRVDDQPIGGLPLAEAIERMRGQPGTPVSITIQRAGTAQEFTVSLTRDIIRRQLLRWSMEGEVLVLRLAGFSSAAAASLVQAIADATALKQPRAVILDLRGNPGGLLREAVKVADTFLREGEIVSLRGSTPARQRAWQADADELLAGLPMVVLVDGRSASASELVADALQHNGRATVMGQRSFGKGSVQTTFPLGEHKGALKLTTAIYHGPSGQTVHKVGVAPDVELLADASPPRSVKARVDPGRCKALKASDPALSCAVAYLLAGSIDAFVAGLSD